MRPETLTRFVGEIFGILYRIAGAMPQQTAERHIVEIAARDLTAQHYSLRLNKPIDDQHVQTNVDGNWRAIGLPAVRNVLQSLAAQGFPVPDG